MTKKSLTPLLALPFLWGCASYPEDVAPTYVPSSNYDNFTCDSLEEAYDETESRLRTLWQEQKEEADSDVGWVVGGALLFFPAMIAAADGDVEEELGEIKGRREAIVETAVEKGCDDIVRKAATQQ